MAFSRSNIWRVLIVDDDDTLRLLLGEMLQILGLEVTAAGDGAEALAQLAAGESFDLLITDIRMPGHIDGPVLANSARALYPAMRVVVMTGYGGERVAALPDDMPILKKPFRLKDLQELISDLGLASTP
ncbi:response regulator [Dyella sp. EPa41]|uniref:response regulator n=1 Tax=Dyella sp. EPa41 TaxID=1561194 RepID=UPI001915F511|nr:response regulator [Dyella sp. EPa41]